MAKKSSLVKLAGFTVALSLAFWTGRASKGGSGADDSSADGKIRSSSRTARASSSRGEPPNRYITGDKAITTTLEMRDIFKSQGYDLRRSTAEATRILDTMNAEEVSRLVHELAASSAATPGYAYGTEIGLACTRWAEIEPKAALTFALSSKQTSFKSLAVNNIFPSIAKADVEYAWQLMDMVKDPGLHESIKRNLVNYVAVSRPDFWLREVTKDTSLIRGHMLPASYQSGRSMTLQKPPPASTCCQLLIRKPAFIPSPLSGRGKTHRPPQPGQKA